MSSMVDGDSCHALYQRSIILRYRLPLTLRLYSIPIH